MNFIELSGMDSSFLFENWSIRAIYLLFLPFSPSYLVSTSFDIYFFLFTNEPNPRLIDSGIKLKSFSKKFNSSVKCTCMHATPIQVIFYESKASKFKLVISFIYYIIYSRTQFMRVDFTIYRCTIFEPESYDKGHGAAGNGTIKRKWT